MTAAHGPLDSTPAGAPDETPPGSPDEPLRLGVLGCARINKRAVIDANRHVPGLVLHGVAARDPRRAASYAAEHGFDRAYASYDDLLADPDIEVVYNPLPNGLHAAWSIAALEAGKAVLCEKPLANNAEEAQVMVDAADRTGQLLIEAFHYRCHPVARHIVDVVASGVLGPLRTVDASFLLPDGALNADDIRFDLALGGGVMMDLGCYCTNLARLVTGTEPTVLGATATLVRPGVDITMDARLAFPGSDGDGDDIEGHVHASYAHTGMHTQLVVTGDDGELEVTNPFTPYMGSTSRLRTGHGLAAETREETFERTSSFVFQARELIAAVRHGGPVRTTAADGVANMAVIDAVYRHAGLEPRPGGGV